MINSGPFVVTMLIWMTCIPIQTVNAFSTSNSPPPPPSSSLKVTPKPSDSDSSKPSVAQCLLNRVKSNDSAGEVARNVAAPFVVDDEVMGAILPNVVDILLEYPNVFHVTDKNVKLLDPTPGDNDDNEEGSDDDSIIKSRSAAFNDVMLDLRNSQPDLIPALQGWRDELFSVRSSFHSKPKLIIERACAPLFGVPAYGVFVNGYTCEGDNNNTPTHIWIGRRSSTKQTWPSRLDCLAAGGLSSGMLPKQSMINECQEEAGIPEELLLDNLKSVSAVSYTGYNDDRWGLKRDVLYCFDLQLPVDFKPIPVDGEMESFMKINIKDDLIDLLAKPILEKDDSDNEWKTNCGVVLIDFLCRHGFVDVDDPAYLQLIGSLRGAPCI